MQNNCWSILEDKWWYGFVNYILEVAYMMIADYKLKTDIIAVSIMHNIVEDIQVKARMFLDSFEWRIA